MKRKVGTTLDAALYERAKQVARRQGRTANALIEDALSRFLDARASPASVVSETRAIFKVSSRAVRAVLREDLYGVE